MKAGEKKGEVGGGRGVWSRRQTQTEKQMHKQWKKEGEIITCIQIYTKNKQIQFITINDSIWEDTAQSALELTFVTSVSNVTKEPATGELCLPIWKP